MDSSLMWRTVAQFPRFQQVVDFNRGCQCSRLKYLIFITWTENFNLLQDLRILFNSYQKTIVDFQTLCRRYECGILYSTFYTQTEKYKLGPIARVLSNGFIRGILSDFPRDITLVQCYFKNIPQTSIDFHHFLQLQSDDSNETMSLLRKRATPLLKRCHS